MNNYNIFNISSEKEFNAIALEVFYYQYKNVNVYRKYVDLLKKDISNIYDIQTIPFLPIEFFKTHKIITDNNEPEIIFQSSGTTGVNTSKHYIKDMTVYDCSFATCFNFFYGDIKNYCLLALLPSYLKRKNSSLIYMIQQLIKATKNNDSGFYHNNYTELITKLKDLKKKKQKTILFGVSYALLDIVEKYSIDIPDVIVMETGGMKGKRKEITKKELHFLLCEGLGHSHIHSEYSMTELLSQAYSKGNNVFLCPPWMKVIIRDINDARSLLKNKQTGGINIIDLANYNSCSFIATDDIGKIYTDDSFELLGRIDNSDIRGCNLMIE